MARLRKHESTSKKTRSLELLSLGTTQEQVSEQVGVTVRTLRRWLKEPEFVEELHNKSLGALRNNLPQLYNVLLKEASKGSHQHLKLILEHLERVEQARSQAIQGSVTFTWSPKDAVSKDK